MQILFTKQAEIDLEEIGDYIAADNPSRAISFVQEIREQCAQIATSPPAEALSYNALVQSWPEMVRLASGSQTQAEADQGALFADEAA